MSNIPQGILVVISFIAFISLIFAIILFKIEFFLLTIVLGIIDIILCRLNGL
jgi:hypothetical protein